jgi:chromosome segregation ATPase
VKRKGRAYIGEWMVDEDTSSNSLSDTSDDEDEAVAGLAIASMSTPAPASPTSTSTSHMCLMAKGGKVKTFDDSSDDDDDLPSYDELASLVQEQNRAVSKLSTKLDKAKNEKKNLLSKVNELEPSNDQGMNEKMQARVDSLEECNKKLASNEKLSTSIKQAKEEFDILDQAYKLLKKSHYEQVCEIKELNEAIEEVNLNYNELIVNHDDLNTRHHLLQLSSLECEEEKKKLELNLNALNSISKVDESPNDINTCDKTCVPKSEYEKIKIELKQVKSKLSESPNALKDCVKQRLCQVQELV